VGGADVERVGPACGALLGVGTHLQQKLDNLSATTRERKGKRMRVECVQKGGAGDGKGSSLPR